MTFKITPPPDIQFFIVNGKKLDASELAAWFGTMHDELEKLQWSCVGRCPSCFELFELGAKHAGSCTLLRAMEGP